MADLHSGEVSRSLHKWGFGVRADPTVNWTQQGKGDFTPGRADLMVVKNGYGCYIEIKSGKTGFLFSHYEPHQRQWAETYALPIPYQTPVWIWLFLGTDPPNRNPERYVPRKAWLVPYFAFLEVEQMIAPYQATLPYRVKKGLRKELQEGSLDACTLFRDYELQWNGGGVWMCPESHLFRQVYSVPPDFIRRLTTSHEYQPILST